MLDTVWIGQCGLHLCVSDTLTNVRYADDIALCSISWQDLFHMMVVLHEELGLAGLEINNANFHNKITKLPYVHWDCGWHGWSFVWCKHPEIPCKINPLEISITNAGWVWSQESSWLGDVSQISGNTYQQAWGCKTQIEDRSVSRMISFGWRWSHSHDAQLNACWNC